MRLTSLNCIAVSAIALSAVSVSPAIAASTPAITDFNTCAKPVWPKEALAKRQQGKVTLALHIGADGAVTDAKVEKSSGYPLLDAAARDGIGKCVFTPATKDGKPQAAWMKMQYVWTLAKDKPDPAVAAAAYDAERDAAERGDMAAALRVAWRYLAPDNAERDPEQGTWWLRKAAEGGNVEAMEHLGLRLLQGKEMPQDGVEAARWLEQAAEAGSPGAQMRYGLLLLSGAGVAKDEPAGEAWLRRAAAQDDPQSLGQLALWLLGRDAMDTETIAMLERAAGRGDAKAQVLLGQCYEQGAGVARDYATAFELYAKAAAAGSVDGRRHLAHMHAKGLGVPEDKAAAQALLRQAAATVAAGDRKIRPAAARQ